MEHSEQALTEQMAAALRALGLKADHYSTGGGCWSAGIELSETQRIELTCTIDDTVWCWSLFTPLGQVMGGHWNTADTAVVAARVKVLVESMGEIVA